MPDTKTSIQQQKAWLSQHMADTKRLWAEGVAGGMQSAGKLNDYLWTLRAEWDRLEAVEVAGEAAGWR